MTPIILERRSASVLTAHDMTDLGRQTEGEFERYGARWRGSFLSADGRNMVCHLEADDPGALCDSAGFTGDSACVAWPGELHSAAPGLAMNVLVARRWQEPVTLDAIQAIEDRGAWCLETRNVRFVCTFFSADHTRMLCLYNAPDAESVREAQREAGMPVESVWPCTHIPPTP